MITQTYPPALDSWVALGMHYKRNGVAFNGEWPERVRDGWNLAGELQFIDACEEEAYQPWSQEHSGYVGSEYDDSWVGV